MAFVAQDQEDESERNILVGQVKWFDSARGYGFVVAPGIDSDILLHANVLRNYGQNSVSDGSTITLRITQTRRGVQAQEVIRVEPPHPGLSDQTHMLYDASLDGGPLEPARVKWFDRAKGFGFANTFGCSDDVFIHMEVLRQSSLADLEPGEAIAVSVAEGERGKLATKVCIWESATSDR